MDLPDPGIKPRSPTLQADSLPSEPPGKAKNTGVDSLSLLWGIFPTQGSNWGLLHCRQILYQLSYQGSPNSGMPTNKCKSNGEITGNGTLLQCSCLENPRDGGAWLAAVYGVAQSRTQLKRSHQEAYTSLLALFIKGQTEEVRKSTVSQRLKQVLL